MRAKKDISSALGVGGSEAVVLGHWLSVGSWFSRDQEEGKVTGLWDQAL